MEVIYTKGRVQYKANSVSSVLLKSVLIHEENTKENHKRIVF